MEFNNNYFVQKEIITYLYNVFYIINLYTNKIKIDLR